MRAYIAAPYCAHDHADALADELTRLGYTIVSTWHHTNPDNQPTPDQTGPAPALEDNDAAAEAANDLTQIDRSDIVVVLTAAEAVGDGPKNTGGRHVETGYALARGIPIIIVGHPEHIFHRHRAVTRVHDWHDAVIDLGRRLVDRERNQPHPDDSDRRPTGGPLAA